MSNGVVNLYCESVHTPLNVRFVEAEAVKAAVMTADKLAVKVNRSLGHNRTEGETESAALGVEFLFIPNHALVFQHSELGVPYRGNACCVRTYELFRIAESLAAALLVLHCLPSTVKALHLSLLVFYKQSCHIFLHSAATVDRN